MAIPTLQDVERTGHKVANENEPLTAANPDLQKELNQANDLFIKVAEKLSRIAAEELKVGNEVSKFLSAPPSTPQEVETWNKVVQQFQSLQNQKHQEGEASNKIKNFVQLLQADKKPSEEIKKNFWNWAHTHFGSSSIQEQKTA